jgi:hypothetical protein
MLVYEGDPITLLPDQELMRDRFLKGEVDLKLVLFQGLPMPEIIPDINK